eukprot:UN01941
MKMYINPQPKNVIKNIDQIQIFFNVILKESLQEKILMTYLILKGTRKELAKIIVKMFTKETFLYKVLTKAQRECPPSKILTLGPYNEIFNKSLDRLRREKNVKEVYRGCDLTVKQISEWKNVGKNSTVSFPCHSSTSGDKDTAVRFLGRHKNKNKVLFKIVFPHGLTEDSMTVPIGKYSEYPGENEILVDPEEEFVVTSVVSKSDLVTVTLEQKTSVTGVINGDFEKHCPTLVWVVL